MSGDLEAKVRKLEDIEEIKQLYTKYGYFIDLHQNEEVVNPMVEDVITEYGPFGSYRGRAEVKAFLDNNASIAHLM
jgi:hypothetical protein